MRVLDAFLAEFDHEIGVTRRLIALAPDARAAFTPHPRSFSLGELCLHLATVLSWMPRILHQAEFDLHPPDQPPPARAMFEDLPTARAAFERSAAAARAALAATSDAELMETWSLKEGGRLLFTLPRAGVVRAWVFNHLVHHRGQLTVYLRMCDVALPPVYGPTADSEGKV